MIILVLRVQHNDWVFLGTTDDQNKFSYHLLPYKFTKNYFLLVGILMIYSLGDFQPRTTILLTVVAVQLVCFNLTMSAHLQSSCGSNIHICFNVYCMYKYIELSLLILQYNFPSHFLVAWSSSSSNFPR